MGWHPTTQSTLVEHLLKHPSCRGRQLSVDCCVSSSNRGHLWPETGASLNFLMWRQMAVKANEFTMVPPNPMASVLHLHGTSERR